jgi:hypothetical protein
LFLEGASWDYTNGLLIDQKPGEMNCKMPVIWLETQKEEKKKDDDDDVDENEGNSKKEYYPCPVFKTAKRTQIIAASGNSNDLVMEIVYYIYNIYLF